MVLVLVGGQSQGSRRAGGHFHLSAGGAMRKKRREGKGNGGGFGRGF